MTKRGRLRDELRRMGSSPVPVLDPVRAQRLERRVLGVARARELELVETESIDAPRVSRRRAAVVALAAACVLAVVVIGSIDRTRSSDRILFTSGDVEVVLPDGSVVDGSTGMVVPDGAILRLGVRAEAAVDGIAIAGAGDYLVTRDGLTLLTTSDPEASTSPPTTDQPSTIAAAAPAVATEPDPTEPVPATNVVRPSTTARVPATTAVRPTTTARATATTPVRPTTSQRVAPPPPPASTLEPRQTAPPAPTSSSTPETTPPASGPATPSSGTAPLDVMIRSEDRRVVLSWRAVAGATRYVVAALPAVAEGAGSWPPAPGIEVTELHAGILQYSVTRPAEGAWSYRVAALGRDERTLALSRVITIES